MTDLGPFQSAKLWVREMAGLEKDTLHVLTGLLVFVLVMLIFRKKPWQKMPLAAAALAALAGEAWDLYELIEIRDYAWADVPWNYLTHDLWVTTIFPAGIFLMAFALRPETQKAKEIGTIDSNPIDREFPPD